MFFVLFRGSLKPRYKPIHEITRTVEVPPVLAHHFINPAHSKSCINIRIASHIFTRPAVSLPQPLAKSTNNSDFPSVLLVAERWHGHCSSTLRSAFYQGRKWNVLKKVTVMRSEQAFGESKRTKTMYFKNSPLKLRRLKLRRLEMKTNTVKRFASAMMLLAIIASTVLPRYGATEAQLRDCAVRRALA